MTDYERIARVIRYIDEYHTEQPDLAALADYVGLSPSRFHHLFSSWAAITPKDFLQCITLNHAKELLKKGNSVLDTALDSGLSGAGRLHDLCVTLEAASPGELKTGGRGWTILAGFGVSPFGKCLIGESPRGICHLSFVDTGNEGKEWNCLQESWPQAELQLDNIRAVELLNLIFNPAPVSRPGLKAYVHGTPFQIQVWRALMNIQPGTLVSYRMLAELVGNAHAARAVGRAIGRNPLAFLIPCHRVIRETGIMGNYKWGFDRKRVIVAWESADRY